MSDNPRESAPSEASEPKPQDKDKFIIVSEMLTGWYEFHMGDIRRWACDSAEEYMVRNIRDGVHGEMPDDVREFLTDENTSIEVNIQAYSGWMNNVGQDGPFIQFEATRPRRIEDGSQVILPHRVSLYIDNLNQPDPESETGYEQIRLTIPAGASGVAVDPDPVDGVYQHDYILMYAYGQEYGHEDGVKISPHLLTFQVGNFSERECDRWMGYGGDW